MIKELFKLIGLLFQSNPVDVIYSDLEVVEMKHFPFKGYKAMSWCGKIIHRVGTSKVDNITMNHEKIHVMQAFSCGDSWWKYYLLYIWEWLRCGFMSPLSANYYVSKFESEAYANEADFDYCNSYSLDSIEKYKIPNAKKKYNELGGKPSVWKSYVKSL